MAARREDKNATTGAAADPTLLAGAFGHVRDAVAIVDADTRILFSNPGADDLLGGRGPLLRRGSRIACRDSACDEGVRKAVEAACRPSPAVTTICLDDAEAGRVIFAVSPVSAAGGERLALLVSHREPLFRRQLAQTLQSLFVLTPAEAEIAVDVAAGRTLAEIGRRRRVAVNTVRVQFKALAAKLGCSRQAEVMALVRALPVPCRSVDPASLRVFSFPLLDQMGDDGSSMPP
jgi:DNA-binding CsgD family transcriptional regulator